MAEVDPEAASVTTNGDSSLKKKKKKIRPNQITKQTAKTIKFGFGLLPAPSSSDGH